MPHGGGRAKGHSPLPPACVGSHSRTRQTNRSLLPPACAQLCSSLERVLDVPTAAGFCSTALTAGMCLAREAVRRLSVTLRKHSSMMGGNLVANPANGSVRSRKEMWERADGFKRGIWSIAGNCTQENIWSVREVGLVSCGELGCGRWSQRGHLPLGVTDLGLEEFLAFMLEAETSEQGPCQMRPGEKHSSLRLHFWEAKSQSELLQRQP